MAVANTDQDNSAIQAGLPATDSVRALQDYVWNMNKARGFNTQDPSQKLVLLMEEVGELAKAVRQSVGMKFTDTTEHTEVSDEVADVLIVLLGLGSMLQVDVYQAFMAKEHKNSKRVWK